MTKAREQLQKEIEKINDPAMIDKVRIFVAGMMAQQMGEFCKPVSAGKQLPPPLTPAARLESSESEATKQCALF